MAVVFDTNVLVSAVLLAQSRPSLAVRWAATNDQMLASAVTFSELVSTFVAFVYANVQFVTIERTIRDLLALDPFEGVSIITATDYLARFAR